jgi:hypothetical protein
MDNDLGLMDNETLILEWITLRDTIEPLRDRMLTVEFRLQKNMETEGATEYSGASGRAELLTGSPRIDQDKLDAIYEYLDPLELAEAGAVKPAHTVDVERKWNMTKLKPFARRGRQVADIIEAAREYPRAKLKVTTETNTLSVRERAND